MSWFLSSPQHYNFMFVFFIVSILGGCLSSQSLAEVEATGKIRITSRCKYKDDSAHGGVLVDCQGQSLSSIPSPDWLPENTTTLLLGRNNICQLDNDSFTSVPELIYLGLDNNILNSSSIAPKAFHQNRKLQFLDLQSNRIFLDNVSVRYPWFYNLHNLVELRLHNNGNSRLYGGRVYPPYLLDGLVNLRTLSLETFPGNLSFNGIFNETKHLTSLVLSGGVTAIVNESFRIFDEIELTNLCISGAEYLNFIEQGAFRYLHDLHSYSIDDSPLGMKHAMESLEPFVQRNFTLLRFKNIRVDSGQLVVFGRDSVMTNQTVRFLTRICVETVEYSNNNLFFIEHGILFTPTWSRCLKSIDLSQNPILGENMIFFEMMRWHNIMYVTFVNRKYSLFDRNEEIPPRRQSSAGVSKERVLSYSSSHSVFSDKLSLETYNNSNVYSMPEKKTDKTQSTQADNSSNVYSMREGMIDKTHGVHDEFQNIDFQTPNFLFHPFEKVSSLKDKNSRQGVNFTFPLPKNLVYLNFDGFGRHTLRCDANTHFIGGEKIEELHLSDCGLFVMTGSIEGINNLRILDISKNDGSQLMPSFLSSFPKLSFLNMSKMSLGQVFMKPESLQLFRSLPQLEKLDISENNIHNLHADIFSHNKELKYLILTGNRFNHIPIDLKYTPNLLVLNLRANSFLQLSNEDVQNLEMHALNNPTFTVKLHGNVLSCSCSDIRFLHWLQTTKLNLDKNDNNNNHNYSCTLENGRLTTTSSFQDVAGLWRSCNGKDSFLTSLILLSLMALAFLAVVLWTKNKTQIMAFIFQFIRTTFSPKVPEDYSIGVYMGYADEETNLACLSLKPYIESHLKLTTYVRHRDLLPASDMAASTVSAILSSWRILLVLTESYLNDRWSYLAMKTAVHSVSISNPGRLVLVILSEDIVQHIPRYLVSAVQEENVVFLNNAGYSLTDDERRALETALT